MVYRSIDPLLDCLVYEGLFAAPVIIDKYLIIRETLSKKFQFGVELLELARYQDSKRECIYYFDPFLADLITDVTKKNELDEFHVRYWRNR
jgi:hypothetical protein